MQWISLVDLDTVHYIAKHLPPHGESPSPSRSIVTIYRGGWKIVGDSVARAVGWR